MTTPSTPELPGHQLDRVIGKGASGTVWAGRDAVGRAVAIKLPHAAPDAETRAQAEIERHILMAVRHEHLVPLRDVVRLEDERCALVFDLVDGGVLRTLVAARGHLRPGETVTVLSPIAEAVAALHVAGGLHGDISANNIMVTAEGRPVLLDLGAARVAGCDSGAVVGTPGFVAPEVRSGARPSTASDVFALGAVAWHCLTGNGAPDTVTRLDLETVSSHVGAELAEIVAACIDPDPSLRPGAGEVARAFYDAVTAEPIEVVIGADDASALTHRIRAEARSDSVSVVGAAARDWGRQRILLSAAVGIMLALGIVWSVLGRPTAEAAGALASRPVSASTPTVGITAEVPMTRGTASTAGAPQPSTATSGVLRDPAAASDRSALLLQVLSDRRAQALMARDVDLLTGVHAPNSPSWQSDSQLIATLIAGRNTYQGLGLQVAQATRVSASTDRATIRARIDWAGYTVVGPAGRALHPAARGDLLDFDLVRGSAGWRILRVSHAPAN